MKGAFKKYRVWWWKTFGSSQHPYPSPGGYKPTDIFVKARNTEEAMDKARKFFINAEITDCVITVNAEP